MQTQIHETQAAPTITLDTRKSVEVSMHTAHQVVIAGEGAAKALWEPTPEPDSYRLRAKYRIELRVPQDAIVRVERVGGHLHLEDLPRGGHGKTIGGHLCALRVGSLRFDSVGGHAELRQMHGSIHCNHVGGHLDVAGCRGDLAVQRIGGHAHVADVQGDYLLPRVGGHAVLREVAGAYQVDAKGHVEIALEPHPRHTYDIKAKGHIALALPASAQVRFHTREELYADAYSGAATPNQDVGEVHLKAHGRVHVTRTA